MKQKIQSKFQVAKSKMILAVAILFGSINAHAQGAAGIDQASSELATYIDPIGNMMMIIGGIVGLIGAIRVYIKWNNGDQDVQKSIMGWAGSCIFLVVSGAIVKAFFGI